MKELICIVRPKGCRLKVDEEHGFAVAGNTCPRGEEYGKAELQNPARVLTSIVRIEGAPGRCCPVKTDRAVPKKEIFRVMETLKGITLQAPVKTGDVVCQNACGTGASWIATKDMKKAE